MFHISNLNTEGQDILGMYLKSIAGKKPLSPAEEYETAALIKKGDKKALKRLIEANLRFVVSVACNYQNQGLPLPDLIGIGNIGLIKAAKHFDEKKNFKFISYAVWWIRQAILQSLSESSRIVRLPINRSALMHKINKARLKLEQKYHRKATESEISEELGIKDNDIKELLRIGNSYTSLNSPIGSKSGGQLLDFFCDKKQENQEENCDRVMLKKQLDKILDELKTRDQLIIRLYFGLDEDINYTLEEIGHRLGVTRERIRQIKNKALKKLQRSHKRHDIRCYL